MERCTLTFEQVFLGVDDPQSCRQPCWWMVAQRARCFRIFYHTQYENVTGFDVDGTTSYGSSLDLVMYLPVKIYTSFGSREGPGRGKPRSQADGTRK